jgi:hypothetical protein
MSAPPARLWISSRDVRDASLAWLSASPKVISFSFESPAEVSSGFVFKFSAEAAFVIVCPPETDEVSTWKFNRQLLQEFTAKVISQICVRLTTSKD